MSSAPNGRGPDRTIHRKRLSSRVGTAAIIVLLAAACQAGGSGGPSTTPAGTSAVPTSPSLPIASAQPVPTASATATASLTAPSPAPAVDPRADGLDVVFGEFAITLEAALIRPGPVTLIVHNAGQLTHGFEMRIERSGSSSGGDREKIETRTFVSGETLRVEADLPPGVYEVECYVADHDSRGMRALLEVRADAPLIQPSPGNADPGTVRIVQFAFVAANLDVPAGSSVTWTNDDPAPHTVTADNGAFDSEQLDPGAIFSIVLDTPGAFAYHCEIHPTMIGALTVN